MACTRSVVILVTLVTCSLVILASSGQFYASGRYGKRGELSLRSMLWSGSRYRRSNGVGGGRRQQGLSSPEEVAVRNDRFFIGSRYGKRSEEPPATTDGFHPMLTRYAPFWDNYTASNGNDLPTFWDNVWVPSSRVKKSKNKKVPKGSVGLAEVLNSAEENGDNQVACMYTGVRNLYRCYKRKDNSSEDASSDHK